MSFLAFLPACSHSFPSVVYPLYGFIFFVDIGLSSIPKLSVLLRLMDVVISVMFFAMIR